MSIDNSECVKAVNSIKNYVKACFTKCKNKGSTFSGTEQLKNLESAIDLIPVSSGSGGTVSENINGADFPLFTVTKNDDMWGEEYTIDFSAIGVTWRSILCYSDTKQGHFSINKLSDNMCVISAAIFYNSANEYGEADGIQPDVRGTYHATYQINGNSITFTNAEYEATSNGWDSYDDFAAMPNQVSNYVNDYFTDQYKLDKIIVCV